MNHWLRVLAVHGTGVVMALTLAWAVQPSTMLAATGEENPPVVQLDFDEPLGQLMSDGSGQAHHVRARYQAGLVHLEQSRDVVVTPRPVGAGWPELRKPRRKIEMIDRGLLWIDAEDFTDYGGWLLDTQFVHLMGSAYLIAAGVGRPVDDATVEVEISAAGTYRLWVRAKNWFPTHSPGKFAVRVGSTTARQIMGTGDNDRWIWQSAGEFQLARGTTTIALHDLTGYYGRCDALILTTDLDYTPPATVEEIQYERSRLTGLSLQPRLAGEFDVVVVGAGAAGSCAALAAARLGSATALVQNRPVLGGNASIELGVPINGAGSLHAQARESGIIEEVGRIKARHGFPKMSEPFRLAAESEPNLDVFLNQHVFAVEMGDPATITAVKAIDTLTGEVSVYKAKRFIDCTGDGWVGYFAGAQYRLGRESRDEFDEDLAPEQPDKITMSGCIMGRRAVSYRVENMGQPIDYQPPPWAAKLPPPDQFARTPRGLGGQWWLEHEGTIDDVLDAERARDELIRISFGYWNYLKNDWPGREQAANHALTYIPIVEAKRESRRLVGDYLLNQNDVQQGRLFDDRISYGGWPIDVHHPRGIYSGLEGPFDCNPRTPIYTIPYRCLYSVNIDNLLFAGRDMSVTHIALGTVRVQGTLAALGQAAGTAAALCGTYDTTPRGLYEKHIEDLQQTLLKHDQYIPEIRNVDPRDRAWQARATASSTARFEYSDRQHVQLGDLHPLNMPRAVLFPAGEQPQLKSITVRLRSDRTQPTPLKLHLRQAAAADDFSSAADLVTAEATVPPRGESWVSFDLNCTAESPFVWIWLPTTEGISWRLMDGAPRGSCRAYGGGSGTAWTAVPGQYYAFGTQPPRAMAVDHAPEHVINGVARMVGSKTNMWVSDPRQALPQWIEIDFDNPVPINAVYLTFDTDLNTSLHTVPLPCTCVRDYELAWYDGSDWQLVARVTGNFQRRRVHRFETVRTSKLRLTVLATNGAPSARVFEIRAYQE